MDDLRVGKQSAELLAPGGIAFHDDAADTGLLQPGRQIIADPSAAAEHDPPDLPGEDAQIFKQGGQVLGKGGDKQPVPLPQDKVAAGGDGGASPQDGADQDLAADDGPHIRQTDVAQLAAAVHPELHDLRSALGKGVPPQEARVFEQPVNFRGGLVFRVNEHGQAEKLPHLENLLGILGVAYPGDGVKLGIHGVGGGAAQKVNFICPGGGDQQVRVPDTGLTKHVHGCAVALDGHDIVTLHAGFQRQELGVDDRHVVPFAGELPGQGGAHLAVARNDYFHICLRL